MENDPLPGTGNGKGTSSSSSECIVRSPLTDTRFEELSVDVTCRDSDTDNTSSPPSPMVIVRKQKSDTKCKKITKKVPIPPVITMPTEKSQRKRMGWILKTALVAPIGWTDHYLRTAPLYAKFDQKKKQWVENGYKKPYQQHICTVCKKNKTRSYCRCCVGKWLCKKCHSMHVLLKFTAGREQSTEKLEKCNDKHQHRTAPKHAYMFSIKDNKWKVNSENPYQKFRCWICRLEQRQTTYCRTYCTCDPNKWMCYNCHRNKHLVAKCIKMTGMMYKKKREDNKTRYEVERL